MTYMIIFIMQMLIIVTKFYDSIINTEIEISIFNHKNGYKQW